MSSLLAATALSVMLLAGCDSTGAPTQTAIAVQYADLGTAVAIQRETATFNAEQLKITSEYLGTQVTGADELRLLMIRTLEALGVDTSGVAQLTPSIAAPIIDVNVPDSTNALGGITRIPPTPESRPSTATLIPATARPPTIDPTLPNLANVSISSAVDTQDCASAPGTIFEVTTPGIYAVGTANNFPAGFSVTFTWLRDGQPVLSDTFTWDSAVNGRCVWYQATPDQFDFSAGTYSVTFESGGAPIAPPIAFILTDSAAPVP